MSGRISPLLFFTSLSLFLITAGFIFFNKRPYLVFHFDSRSESSRRATELIIRNIKQTGLRLNFYAIIDGNIELPNLKKYVVEDSYFLKRRIIIPRNYYKLLDKKYRTISQGRISDGPSEIARKIIRHFKKNSSEKTSDDSSSVNKSLDFPFSQFIDNATNFDINIYVLHDVICAGCKSGANLNEFELLANSYRSYSFSFIAMADYSAEDLERIKKNGKYHIQLLAPNEKVKSWWEQKRFSKDESHPDEGLIFASDRRGIPIFISKDMKTLKGWLTK
jgi:hypothetical protein